MKKVLWCTIGMLLVFLSCTKEVDYNELTVAELKELLEQRGLSTSGKKADLIKRLQEN